MPNVFTSAGAAVRHELLLSISNNTGNKHSPTVKFTRITNNEFNASTFHLTGLLFAKKVIEGIYGMKYMNMLLYNY